MTGGSPDLDVAMLRAMNIGGCNDPNHGFALDGAAYCRACFAILVAAIRAEALLEAARIAEGQYGSDGTSGYDVGYDAAARYIEAEILALTGSQTPHE